MRGRWFFASLFLLLLFCTLPLGVFAAGGEATDGESIASEDTPAGASVCADALLEEFRTLLPEGFSPDMTDASALGETFGARSLFSAILSAAQGAKGEILSFFFLLLGSALFFSLVGVLRDGVAGTLGEVCEAAVSSVLAVAVFSRLRIVTEETVVVLTDAGRFFGGLLPFLGTVTLAGGGAEVAASQAVTMELTLSTLNALTDGFLLPLASAMFAFGLLDAVGTGGGSLSSLAGSLRRLFLWGLGIVTAVFTTALSLQSVIASAADSAAMRAVRVAVTDMIPLVGGTVSGALAATASGLLYVKSVVGATSIAALLFLALPYLVRLLLYRAAFGVVIGFLSYTGARTGERVFTAFRSALDALTALTALSLLLYIFEIVCFVKCGVAIA